MRLVTTNKSKIGVITRTRETVKRQSCFKGKSTLTRKVNPKPRNIQELSCCHYMISLNYILSLHLNVTRLVDHYL
jgi:hypothetical protein